MTNIQTNHQVLLPQDALTAKAMTLLEQHATCHTPPMHPTAPQLAEIVSQQQINGMIVRTERVPREVLAASPSLKIVSKHGVGVDNIDVEAATELGIAVSITPNANYQSVAEHALSVMFALAKKLALHNRRMRHGEWERFSDMGSELYSKCLGIVGMGRIGRRLTELVAPLQMEVIGYDPFLPADRFPSTVTYADNLEMLLEAADFISIHCPKTPETAGLFNAQAFKRMKPTSILVNTARGGIIDEFDLALALEDGELGAVGLDVFESEPAPEEFTLQAFEERIILTPHIAGVTHESMIRMGVDAAQNVLDYLNGSLGPDVLINPQVLA